MPSMYIDNNNNNNNIKVLGTHIRISMRSQWLEKYIYIHIKNVKNKHGQYFLKRKVLSLDLNLNIDMVHNANVCEVDYICSFC
jgi:hypothetical protein